jgi:hypothetical protein
VGIGELYQMEWIEYRIKERLTMFYCYSFENGWVDSQGHILNPEKTKTIIESWQYFQKDL